MKKHAFLSAIALCLVAFSAGLIGTALAAPQNQAKPVVPKLVLSATQIVKPAQCGAGFTPINIKLMEHEGKKWYQYDCAQQKVIKRTCNADTDVIKVKNRFIDLPSDGQNNDSKMYLSYTCFNYVPVK
ncbi:hypothetical protein [Sedimenticola thiotaurini]|uniref:Uncharacterized protein n=1 Tax=Sedimenticola thiotaurini TaxID=1543721 RepID=A0A0F7JUZ2_9GAMM|nr:hypothetical protein [Sedimenticola thiotaurini]AKH19134.1 hypothetical protein AAY24_00880 [Sedimenticola thiotaurini]